MEIKELFSLSPAQQLDYIKTCSGKQFFNLCKEINKQHGLDASSKVTTVQIIRDPFEPL